MMEGKKENTHQYTMMADKGLLGIRGNPKDVDFFVMQEESRRAVSSTTLKLLC